MKKQITHDNSIETCEQWYGNKQRVEGVNLKLNGSTNSARVFNIALKLAAMDWQDVAIDQVENLIDSRLLEIADGTAYTITCSEGKRTYQRWLKAYNIDRARELAMYDNSNKEIIKIEEYKPED